MSKEKKKRGDLLLQYWPKLLIPFIALVLIVIHMFGSQYQIDAITLGLVIFATLPWIWSRIQSIEITGVGKAEFGELKNTVKQAQSDIQTQKAELQAIKLLLDLIVTGSELEHLQNLNRHEFYAENSGSFLEELRQLQMFGFIEGVDGAHGISSLAGAFPVYGRVNIKDHLHITERGKEYLKQVEQLRTEL